MLGRARPALDAPMKRPRNCGAFALVATVHALARTRDIADQSTGTLVALKVPSTRHHGTEDTRGKDPLRYQMASTRKLSGSISGRAPGSVGCGPNRAVGR